jgi:hypothetical protein
MIKTPCLVDDNKICQMLPRLGARVAKLECHKHAHGAPPWSDSDNLPKPASTPPFLTVPTDRR